MPSNNSKYYVRKLAKNKVNSQKNNHSFCCKIYTASGLEIELCSGLQNSKKDLNFKGYRFIV